MKYKTIGSADSFDVLMQLTKRYFFSNITVKQINNNTYVLVNCCGIIDGYRITSHKGRHRLQRLILSNNSTNDNTLDKAKFSGE